MTDTRIMDDYVNANAVQTAGKQSTDGRDTLISRIADCAGISVSMPLPA